MAADGFTFISSPESDDSAVQSLVSQALDLCTLEQISALSLPALSESGLPTDLETRFQRLKSFPAAQSLHPEKRNRSNSLPRCRKTPNSSPESLKSPILSEEKEPTKTEFSPMDSSSPDRSKDLKPKLGTGSDSSPSISGSKKSPGSSRESPSPPRQVCCFWCSPKRMSRKKNRLEKDGGSSFDPDEDEFLSDFSTFSLKEQRRRLKKALKEQEEVNREAEKVVKWVKQASARMDVSVIEGLGIDEHKFN